MNSIKVKINRKWETSKCVEGCHYQVPNKCSRLFPNNRPYKILEPENSSIKIVVKKSKSTPFEKVFTENGLYTVANVMKNMFMKCKSNPVTHFEVRSTFKKFNQKSQNTKIL